MQERRHSIHIYLDEISKHSFITPPLPTPIPIQIQKTKPPRPALKFKRMQFTNTSTNSLAEWEVWFVRFIRFAYSTACVPIQYIPTEKSFRITSSKGVLFIFNLRLIWLCLDCTYLISSFHLVTLDVESLKEFMDFYLHACTRSAGCFAGIVLSFNLHSTVQVLNTLWKTNRAWAGNYFIHIK